jgi:ELWxxDGT repeat protein
MLLLRNICSLAQEPYPVKGIDPGEDSCETLIKATMSGLAFFRGNDGIHGMELWKSDGTEQGTVMIKDINPGPQHSAPLEMLAVFGTLYFTANDGEHGTELWKSDGTEAGIVMLMDINPGLGYSEKRGG